MDEITRSVIARGDLAHLALFLWASGASALLAFALRELAAAHRRFDVFVRELARFNNRGTLRRAMTDILEGLAVLLHRRAQRADAEDVVRRFIRALVRLRRGGARMSDTIEGYASLFGRVDLARDVVVPGAFRVALARRGAGSVRMLWQHDPAQPIGVWLSIAEDARGLYCRGRLVPEAAKSRRGRGAARSRRARRPVDRLPHRARPHRSEYARAPADRDRPVGDLDRHLSAAARGASARRKRASSRASVSETRDRSPPASSSRTARSAEPGSFSEQDTPSWTRSRVARLRRLPGTTGSAASSRASVSETRDRLPKTAPILNTTPARASLARDDASDCSNQRIRS